MKTIIAGGRNYRLTDKDRHWLSTLGITSVLSGGCRGADADGEEWATACGVKIERINAKWKNHGRAAGPIRNRTMAEMADAVVLFPGGKGTLSMESEAKRKRLKIYKRFHNELVAAK